MEKIYYRASDNVQLNGILEKNGSDTCIIMCHGIRSDKEEHRNFTKLAEVLNKNKIDNFRFDFRGHGENDSDFSTVTISGEIKDLEASIDIISDMGYKNIVLLGESFGGGIISLIDFKKFNNIKGLILWCPCLVYKETNIFCEENVNKTLEDGFLETKSIKTGKKFIFSKELMLETKKYKPYDALLNNILPKLFIHGTNDEVVYYESVRECAKKSNNSELVTVEKGTHGFFDNIEHFNLVLSQTIEYIKKIIILEKVEKLLEMYKKGLLGGEVMPEDSNPHLNKESLENYNYYTLPMALNYQRNSYKLWEAANETWNDSKTNFVFDTKLVSKSTFQQVQTALVKYKIALQKNKQTEIWIKLCNTINELFDGDIRKLFEKNDYDINKIRNYIQKENKSKFPYLSGNKICNYWLYVLYQYTDIKFKNIESLTVAPDTHVVKASHRLGLINDTELEASNVQLIVIDRWNKILDGTKYNPIDVHTPLWLWSRNGFKDIR